MTLLALEEVRKVYPGRERGREIVAVDGVSLAVRRAESFGLVGESGSGKTTLTRLILALEPPTSGRVVFDGEDVAGLDRDRLRHLRARLQIVFQDPYAALDPRMNVRDIIAEPLVIHAGTRPLSRAERTDRVVQLLEMVGLSADHVWRFPHEFSGGQRQRICIARALALEPAMLVLDEPTSALDVSVQAQVLNMLFELQQRLQLTYLFISHDLGVIRYVCDRVALIHRGRIVETGPTEQIFTTPESDYARLLLAANPEPDPDRPLRALG